MNDINESKVIKKLIKKDFNMLGITLIVQGLISNGVVFIVMIGIMIMKMVRDPNISEDQLKLLVEEPSFLGTISIIAVVIAFIPVLIYRRKKFVEYDLKVENRKFTLKTVTIGFIILLSVNNMLGLFANGLELGLNAIGLSAISALEDLDVLNQPTISMIIYTCIIAPIFEEFLYRGAVLRGLEKYGRWFAILVSAILFGLMHGNFYQIFMATAVGIILGYLATEYSIKLTIILHICNNTFVEILSQITSHLSENVGNIIYGSIAGISVIILLITFIRNKNNIKGWLQNNRMEKGIMLRFVTSITVIIIIAYDLYMVVSGITSIS
ncbi:protease [Clostridium gelidum]|uniref:Protease n=1 Tax=Clostridium gelidum TaxID=704125 RepID=A0ABM7T8W7_9CLOT|nr:type II CAAX endopeptidase family protein [Clostridium gelidum]BCZ45394.1 protease [Clostridium gelidum]